MPKIGQVQHFNKALEDGFGFSAIVHSHGLLHLAGVISINEKAEVQAINDMQGQIDRIYDIIEETLAKCGATLEHVVNEVMYTTDMKELTEFLPARAKRYEGYPYPAATAVQISALAFPDAMLEIQVTAQLDKDEWSPNLTTLGSPI